jgi:hypothetical protein
VSPVDAQTWKFHGAALLGIEANEAIHGILANPLRHSSCPSS